MKIKLLKLVNFRNFTSLDLSFGKKIIYLVGLNGQGKTNVVESISVLALLNSFRTSSYNNLQKNGELFFTISGNFIDNDGLDIDVDISFDKGLKKIRLNEKKVSKFSDYWGKIPLVYLIPEEGVITQGPPSERRRFLDKLLSLVSKEYFILLQKYTKVIKSKNKILNQAKKDSSNNNNNNNKSQYYDMIQVYNDQMVEYGSRLIELRIEFLEKYNNYFNSTISAISESIHNGSLKYFSSLDLNNYREEFSKKLSSSMDIEIIRGACILGPHKDDLIFELNELNLRNFGSKGQHKIFLVALKLAEIEFIKSITNEYPIFILDDLYSEIDNEKSKKIAELLDRDIQTFITTHDDSKIGYFNSENLQVLRVSNGEITSY